MNKFTSSLSLLASVAVALALSACGGGGGDSGGSSGGSSGGGNTGGGTGGTGGVASCAELSSPGMSFTGADTQGEVVYFELSSDKTAYRYTIKKSLDTTRQNGSYCGNLTASVNGYTMSEFAGVSPALHVSSLPNSPVLLAAVRGSSTSVALPFVGFQSLSSSLPTSGQYVLMGNVTTGTTNQAMDALLDFAGNNGSPALCQSVTSACTTPATVSQAVILNTFDLDAGTLILGQVNGNIVPLFATNSLDGEGLRLGFPVQSVDTTSTDGAYVVDNLSGTAHVVTVASNGISLDSGNTLNLVYNSPVNGISTVNTLTVGASNSSGLAVVLDSSTNDVLFGVAQ